MKEKNHINYVDFDENGNYVEVHYKSGALRCYWHVNDAPNSVKKLLINADPDNMYKLLVPMYDGKKVSEKMFYRVIA